MKIKPLADEEIERRLLLLPGWNHKGAHLEYTAEFPSFAEAIGFVCAAAVIAEQMDHHPDLDIRWRKVIMKLSSHDAGGITALDFTLAERLAPLLPELVEPVN